MTLKLNIGAGITFLEGFTNIDISPIAEVTVDLDKDPLPFEDNSVDLIFSYHTLEHIQNYLHALKEIHRVLRHGGWLLLGVPYITLTEYNLINPYHKQHFNEFSFDFFDPEKLLGSAAEQDSILFKKVFHRLHYIGIFKLLPKFLQKIARRHLFNVVRKIDFGLIAIKNPEEGIRITTELKSKMLEEFLSCCKKRRTYKQKRIQNKDQKSPSTKSIRTKLRKWWSGREF